MKLEYRDTHEVDFEQLERLRAANGFAPVSRATLEQQVRGARWVVSAWDGGRLIGFARAISDGVSSAYVSTVVVDEHFRGKGVGRELMRRLMDGRGAVRFVLNAREGAQGFYEKADSLVARWAALTA